MCTTSAELTTALSNAELGDIIELQAGTTFAGPFTLPNKTTGNGWIVIRSSAYASLPEQTRVSLSQASLMAKITAPNSDNAITTDAAAHHFRFIGIEICPVSGGFCCDVVRIGNFETQEVDLPHHLIFDRCYIHGDPSVGSRRGVRIDGKSIAVIDSYISDCKEEGWADTQAISCFNGAGPFKIHNNYLEGAGENVIFGGVDPVITNLVPSDITFTRNYCYKPLRWRQGDPNYESGRGGQPYGVKNLFELKNARRVFIDGNIFEHNWEHAQDGTAILFTVRNQDGTAPWSMVKDVTFTNNIVRHVGQGINMLGGDWPNPSDTTERVLIRNNLFEDVDPAVWGGNGRLLKFVDGVSDVTFEHNTVFLGNSGQGLIFADGAASPGFICRNNISAFGLFGVIGTGTGVGNNTIDTYFPGHIFTHNMLADGESGL